MISHFCNLWQVTYPACWVQPSRLHSKVTCQFTIFEVAWVFNTLPLSKYEYAKSVAQAFMCFGAIRWIPGKAVLWYPLIWYPLDDGDLLTAQHMFRQSLSLLAARR